jgi:DNA invertase Pin-like site-specific DNA recombinase
MTKKRAALYARFSSDLQKDRSIDDQLALCRVHAIRKDLEVVDTFVDRAKSGAGMNNRDGLYEMMQAAKRGAFDVIVMESLDRLSRDQADLPALHKRLVFANVAIETVNEGEATPIHVGLRSMVGSMFLRDLADKCRRGASGRVREGKFPGARVYGYRCIAGKPGEREIDPDQAAIVVRIFREYAAGKSPRKIAGDLSREGITAPGGSTVWSNQCLTGGRVRQGMIGNRLYIGEIRWNRTRVWKNPETEAEVRRATPTEDHLSVAVPHLRIIPQDLWDAANGVRSGRAIQKFGPGGKIARAPVLVRKDHLLSGLLRCGECGGKMRIYATSATKGTRVACAAAKDRSTCEHGKTYHLETLERGILKCMRTRLAEPELLKEALKAFHAEWSKQRKHCLTEHATLKRRLVAIEASTTRFVSALERGSMPEDLIVTRLQALETERVGVAERMRLLDADATVVDLHPAAMSAYCASMDKLHAALEANRHDAEARQAFRTLIDSVIVHRTPDRAPYQFTPYHRMEALMGVDLFPPSRPVHEIIEENGGAARSISAKPPRPDLAQANPKIVSFGRYRMAA